MCALQLDFQYNLEETANDLAIPNDLNGHGTTEDSIVFRIWHAQWR